MRKSKKTVHFLSAADRINYGDLLFPIIFQRVFDEENYEVSNYGIVKSNFSHFGALPTASYRNLQKAVKEKGGNVVIGGGEVFFAGWNTLFRFISRSYSFLGRSDSINRILAKLNVARRLLSSGGVLYPCTPSPHELGNAHVSIIYNSVGGRFIEKRRDNDKLSSNLLSAKYISVRTRVTQDSLREFGVDSILAPDSALIMSDFFKLEDLAGKITIDRSGLPEKYVVFQMGVSKGPEDLKQFALMLDQQLELLDVDAVLCPIGMAPNHDDQKILGRIRAASQRFHLRIPGNLFDVMYLVASSRAYIGTSLHGIITAQSFNVPFVPLNKDLVKLDSYCATWIGDLCTGCLGFDEIDQLETILSNWKSEEISKKTTRQKRMVYQNFDRIKMEMT
ncbi:MAG: polysaccharide pyruvyl transferase family protein [Gammaproteobacteria bacterium]|nr:polysaccharide pyruvyl transferase family protein [Gammaproteobacteria bacterium]MDH3467765.1 polysaccharide pyruvyl transferase family protein [Gammaproteobacteria bacterium]